MNWFILCVYMFAGHPVLLAFTCQSQANLRPSLSQVDDAVSQAQTLTSFCFQLCQSSSSVPVLIKELLPLA